MFPQIGGAQPAPAAPQAPVPPGNGFSYGPQNLPPAQPAPGQQQVVQPQPGQQVGGQQQAVPQPGQQPAQPQPQFVPQLQVIPGGQQPGQQPQPQPQHSDLGMVLQGDNVPPQWRGKTLGEALGFVNGVMNYVRQGGQPGQPVPGTQSMQPAQQPGQPAQSQQPVAAAEFFRDPNGAITRAIETALPQILDRTGLTQAAAMAAQSAIMTQAQAAQNTVATEIGVQRFQQLYPHMQPYLSSVPAQALANPETWRLAARAAAGEQALRGPVQPQPQQPSQAFGTPAGAYPVQVVGPNGQPVPGVPSFFTEAPNAGAPGQRVQLTPLQEFARQQMGMDVDSYIAWLGGVQPTQPGVRR